MPMFMRRRLVGTSLLQVMEERVLSGVGAARGKVRDPGAEREDASQADRGRMEDVLWSVSASYSYDDGNEDRKC